MPFLGIILPPVAGVLAATFALATLLIPLLGAFNFWNESGFSSRQPDQRLLGLFGYALAILAFCVFSLLVSLAFLRYALWGPARTPRSSRTGELGHVLLPALFTVTIAALHAG